VPPRIPVHAWLDARCLDGILHNLVGNAVKFTEAGRIRVRVGQEGGRVFVEVQDTGIGIDEHFLPHLFDEFKQESTGLARSHEGSGLGLAVTYRLVKLMNGDITVQSTKGEGSVFTVSFPVYVPQSAPASGEAGGDGMTAPVRFVN
jgi:signal transduction histidine kinase